MNKKGIGPVIASALFLVVAVVAVISFQTWFAQYGSDIFTNVETRSTESVSNTKIEAIMGETLYFKNGFNSNLSILDIKVDGNSCSVTTNVSNGMTEITLSNNCTNNLTTKTPEVVVYTKSGIYSAYVWYKNATIITQTLSEVLTTPSSFVWYNYNVSNSLRFDGTTSYLSRTSSVSGNRTTWTYSGWIKRSKLDLGVYTWLLGAKTGAGYQNGIRIEPDNTLRVYSHNSIGSGPDYDYKTNRVFRDTSDWTNIIVSLNTKVPELKIWVDGVEETSFSTLDPPSLNYESYINSINTHTIGSVITSNFYDGYMSEVNFIDGQALNASYFGEFNDAGKWTPKKYDGTYGTNGFYLEFNNNSTLPFYSESAMVFNSDSNSRLLIHSNTTDGITLFTDNGAIGYSVTPTGAVHHEIDQQKFGSTSIQFDGVDDKLNVGSGNDFTWIQNTGQAKTLECWFYTTSNNNQEIFNIGGTQHRFALGILPSSNQIYFGGNNGFSTSTSNVPISLNNWHHLAVQVDSSNNGYFLFDGEIVHTFTQGSHSMSDAADGLQIGTYQYRGGSMIQEFTGYMDEIRISNVARYNLNYTLTLGGDSSGNENNWFLNNLDSTDVMIDTPTNNHWTWSNLDHQTYTLANGNLELSRTAASTNTFESFTPLPKSGKWYFEITSSTLAGSPQPGLGLVKDIALRGDSYLSTNRLFIGNIQTGDSTGGTNGDTAISSATSHASTYDLANDRDSSNVYAFAIDMDNKKIWVGGVDSSNENFVWFNDSTGTKGDPSLGTNPVGIWTYNGDVKLGLLQTNNAGTWTGDLLFGQGGISGVQWCENAKGYFRNCPPTGFKALSTNNLPSPAINISKQFFDVLNYTGDGNAKNITGLNFTPDLVWGKSRNTATSHLLFDLVRGPSNYLSADSPNLELNDGVGTGLTAFISGGFTHDADSGGYLNFAGRNYVVWNWKESQLAGFDIVKDTSVSPSKVINHSLNTTPDFIIAKRTDSAGDEWVVYHNSLGFGGNLLLSTTAIFDYPTAYSFASANNNSFTLGAGAQFTGTYLFYLFAEKEGFSKFGKYTGNGLADGPFVYTGFKPAYIMLKNTNSGTAGWSIYDYKRNGINGANDNILRAEDPAMETSGLEHIDLLSNGFKPRYAGGWSNTNGNTIVYVAFAEYPFR